MKKSVVHHQTGSERVLFTLPKGLAAEVRKYASVLRDGNMSGFVADAIRSYIDYFRRRRHTALLRQSYAASAALGRSLAREWEPLDDETWAQLDRLEANARKSS